MRDPYSVYAGGAVTVTGFTLPTLLVVTTTWPNLIVIVFTAVAVAALLGMFGLGHRSGWHRRDDLAYQHAIESARYGTHSR